MKLPPQIISEPAEAPAERDPGVMLDDDEAAATEGREERSSFSWRDG